MSLQFIMGPSGSGKSHYLYRKVTEESIKNPDKNYIVLVPEQFTMQTQKDIVMASPRKGILNVDVLSFNRLAYRVFEETGENRRLVLDDVGKSFVIRKIAGDYEQQLKILGSNLKKPGFIGEMKSILSEFTQYNIQADTLDKLLEGMDKNTSFYHKLKEIQIVCEGFHNYLKDKYITGEELLDVLCFAVPKSKILKDSVIVLDGFTGFTPVQNKLLRELLVVADKVIVTATMNEEKRSETLYVLGHEMVDTLTKIAREVKIEIEDPVTFYKKPVYRFRENPSLAFLEENIFRYTGRTYNDSPEGLSVYHAKNPKEEMSFVAQEIRRLVRAEGFRYRDIAVIASDMDTYSSGVETIFEKYHIPYFMDHKRSILLNSFVEYIRSLIDLAEQNFTYESVFRYLRTNLTGLTQDEIDRLENYCLALGIRGQKKWQEKWIRRTAGMEEADLSIINEIRVRFLTEIEQVMAVLKKRSKTVREVTLALYDFLFEKELQQKVKNYEIMFTQQGELALEKEYAQIYRVVMDLFDQFVELLGEEKISLKEYSALLDAGLETAKVGIIPPGLEQVIIGDIERTRIKDVKVVFFVGVNDIYIPGKAQGGGLLSQRDRERFAEKKIALAPSAKEKAFIQKFYLYSILTKPSQKVVLSYSVSTGDGKLLRPAYVIFDLLRMFSKLEDKKIDRQIDEQELTPESGLSHIVVGLQKKGEALDDRWQELYTWYKKNPEWSERVEQIVKAAFYKKSSSNLRKEIAELLYGSVLENSVTRLEKFSACAYAHFLAYGLKLDERELYQFQAVDLGNLFHGAMERFATKLRRNGFTWITVPEKDREIFIKESVEECIIDYSNTILYSSARNEYMITRLERMMKRTVWALTKQLEKGDFIPEGYEMNYDSKRIELEEGNSMRLHGKIDRVDLCETEDEVFVKVIDYKTGSKKFDIRELYHGLQMQLVLYMNAAMEREMERHPDKKITPAALLYYQMKDPLVEEKRTETLETTILKELCPNGVVNASPEAVLHLDREFEKKSEVIPVAKNKDGSYSKQSSILSEENLLLLTKYAGEKAKQIGSEIMNGNTEISPYEMDNRTSCDYCPYHGICGFDEKISGYKYRKIGKENKEEILAKMEQEVQQWE